MLYKTRFAPSPTGYIHLGNARTALFNALLAHGRGVFLLRIEDTDVARSAEDYTAALQEDMRWLGMDWQEGVRGEQDVGPQPPYRQSQRLAIYQHYYDQLVQQNLAYPCFCTEQQLSLSRKLQRMAGQPPRYAGTCAHLSEQEVAKKIANGEAATLRFRVKSGTSVQFHDFVRGEQRFAADDIGDFIIRRADGMASFLFSNAIDDALMQVTHVMRGEDHVTNTPRQLMLLQALQLPQPQYAHISLITGADGSPLSKRNGSRSIRELRAQGYLAEAVVNYLARLGHYYADPKFLSWERLTNEFSLERLGSAPARFDASQLDYWQKQAVQQLSDERLWQWVESYVASMITINQQQTFVELVRANAVLPQDAVQLAEMLTCQGLTYDEAAKTVLQQAGVSFFEHANAVLNETGVDFKQLTTRLQPLTGLAGKALFMPLRVALTGQLHGPEMVKVVSWLGVTEVAVRLQQAKQIAGEA